MPKMRKKKITGKSYAALFVLTALLSTLFAYFPAFCEEDTSEDIFNIPYEVAFYDKAEAICLYSCNTEKTLLLTGGEKSLSAACTAKLMTGLIACELLSERQNDEVVITSEMLEGASGYSMNLRSGMTVTVRDLLYGTICGANNDAAQALAFVCAGSVSNFLSEMNSYAKRLNMKRTEYLSSNGLDGGSSKTCIADVLKLSRATVKNKLYTEISSAKKFDFVPLGGEKVTLYNRNALLSNFSAQGYLNKYSKGLIAGNTEEGGFTISAYAEGADDRYICIVMGAVSEDDEIFSYSIANSLLNYAFACYKNVRIAEKGRYFGSVPLRLAVTGKGGAQVDCVLDEDIRAYIPKGLDVKNDLTYRVFFHEKEYEAPIAEGENVGGVDVYYGDRLIASGRLVAVQAVDANGLLSFVDGTKSFLTSRLFIVFLIIAAPSVGCYLYFDLKRSRRGRRDGRISRISYKKTRK